MATPTESLVCPITLELFRDPVLAKDGHTYERKAIEDWIRKYGTSPTTGEHLSLEHLYPNRIAKELVVDFETSLVKKNYQFTLNVDVRKKEGRPLFKTTGKTIYQAEWLPTNENRPDIIILKIDGARALQEAKFYVNLTRHPHVVRTFGLVLNKKQGDEKSDDDDEDNSVMLIQEYAHEGSLLELLQEREKRLDENILIKIFLQIIDAMIFLAYNHVVHGDLACRNVLVFRFDETNLENIIVKVTDFGLSRQSQLYSKAQSGSTHTTLDIIPTRYAAPEILSGDLKSNRYTEKSDVYSMGVLMWEGYSRGALPWAKAADAEVIKNVMNSVFLPQPAKCSPKYWNIITKTWSKLPDDRPTFKQLKQLLIEHGVNSSEEQRTNASNSIRVETKPLVLRKAPTPTVPVTDLDKKKEYIFKILVIGEMTTGKTAFIQRYVDNFFSERYKASIGVDFALKIVKYGDDTVIRLQLWDIAGQERFGALTRVYYKDAVGCFITFDVARPTTLQSATKWKIDLDNKVKLPDGNPVPCVLLANKCDLPKEGLVNNARKMDEYCRENGFIKWFETSAKENINIETATQFLINEIMNHIEQIPSPSLDRQRSDTLNVVDKPTERGNDRGNCCGGDNSID